MILFHDIGGGSTKKVVCTSRADAVNKLTTQIEKSKLVYLLLHD